MTSKEYLEQAQRLNETINNQLSEREFWLNRANSVSSSSLSGMPHSPNRPTEAQFVRCVEQIDELDRSVSENIEQLIKLRSDISACIYKLDKKNERLLLRYRYLDDRSWSEIAHSLGVTERTVFRIHDSALEHFPVPA